MATPVISLYSDDNTTQVSTWSPGTVKADHVSSELEVYVWNNKSATPGSANTTVVSDMIECTVGAFDSNGKATDPIAADKWIQANINDAKDSGGTDDKWEPIGGATVAKIYNAAANPTSFTGDDSKDYVLKGTTNTGQIVPKSGTPSAAQTANKVNYAKVRFRIAIPQNADAGTTGFKIRFQGYYV
jgi:hypothetical protein|nr:MAG TPA: hypothetical protein [Caudoviricetes sp.]